MGVFPVLFVIDCQTNIVAIDGVRRLDETELKLFRMNGEIPHRLLAIDRFFGVMFGLKQRVSPTPLRKYSELRLQHRPTIARHIPNEIAAGVRVGIADQPVDQRRVDKGPVRSNANDGGRIRLSDGCGEPSEGIALLAEEGRDIGW